jgi:hypothetical protein
VSAAEAVPAQRGPEMSDLLGRAYNAARGYLDTARGRLEEIDSRAQAELERALPREAGSAPAAADDPFVRAAAKIAAAQESLTAQREEQKQRQNAETVSGSSPTDPITTAYKILGVPQGSDYPTVQAAVEQLRARCAPSRFPDGSAEQAEAQVILQHVDQAYQVLQEAIAPHGGRFDKLEL